MIPPGHTAFVRAELLYFSAGRLRNGSAAIRAVYNARGLRMPSQMRFHGVDRDTERGGYLGRFFTACTHLRYGVQDAFIHHKA